MKKCINTECKFYRVREESRCKETDDVTICEYHNDDPKSPEAIAYKKKIKELRSAHRQRPNKRV